MSEQSGVIASRAELDRREAELLEKFGKGPIPLPPDWGGYRVVPSAVEFWQGRPSRLHDRLLYTLEGERWVIRRLAP